MTKKPYKKLYKGVLSEEEGISTATPVYTITEWSDLPSSPNDGDVILYEDPSGNWLVVEYDGAATKWVMMSTGGKWVTIDDFNEASLNTALWSKTGDGNNNINIANNRLEYTVVSGQNDTINLASNVDMVIHGDVRCDSNLGGIADPTTGYIELRLRQEDFDNDGDIDPRNVIKWRVDNDVSSPRIEQVFAERNASYITTQIATTLSRTDTFTLHNRLSLPNTVTRGEARAINSSGISVGSNTHDFTTNYVAYISEILLQFINGSADTSGIVWIDNVQVRIVGSGRSPLTYDAVKTTFPDILVPLQYVSTVEDGQILYEDSGLTTPVDANGEPIGGVDWPGNSISIEQVSSTARPIYTDGPDAAGTPANHADFSSDSLDMGTASDASFLSAGSAASMFMVLKFDDIAADELTTLASTTNDKLSRGALLLFDNRSSIPRMQQFHLLISDGVNWVTASTSANNAITDNKWHTIAFVYDSTSVDYYVDGALFSSDGAGATFAAGDPAMKLNVAASRLPASTFFDGGISLVSFYGRTLGASEVSDLHAWAVL